LYQGTARDIFQGDIFRSFELMKPTIGGSREFPVAPAIVVSHDCEFTKIKRWGTGYRLLIAPLRDPAAFDTGDGEAGTIRKGQVRFLFYLPQDGPLDREYAVDFTEIQPVTAAELLDLEGELVTCLGPGLKPALMGALAVFFTDRRPRLA
jgi:hypothetical protein